jgi:ribosomal-protein-alanine acetyltransferase
MMKLERDAVSAAHWSEEQYVRVLAGTALDRAIGPKRVTLVVDGRDASTAREIRVAHSRYAQHDRGSEEVVLGFLVAHGVDGEWEIENLVVAESERRVGLGSRLLQEFLGLVKAEGAATAFLEVRKSNLAARGLYKKLGFSESGGRKLYYREPEEDAVLCRISLSELH